MEDSFSIRVLYTMSCHLRLFFQSLTIGILRFVLFKGIDITCKEIIVSQVCINYESGELHNVHTIHDTVQTHNHFLK